MKRIRAKSLVKCSNVSCRNAPVITDYNSGEMICSKCGRVLKEKIVSHERIRTFTKESYEKLTRTGSPSTIRMPDFGLTTVIGSKNKDSSGKKLSSFTKRQFNRLKIQDSWSRATTSGRGISKALRLLQTMKEKLSLSDNVAEEAAYICRKGYSQKLSKGRSIPLLACSSIYAACRANNVPRNLNDIAKIGNVSRKALSKMYRELIKKLDLKFKPYDPQNFISRLASKLAVNEKTKREAWLVLNTAQQKGIFAGKRPMALASAALYLACVRNGHNVSQRQIAKVAGISTITIRKLFHKLKNLN